MCKYLSFLNTFFNRFPDRKVWGDPTLLKSWFMNINVYLRHSYSYCRIINFIFKNIKKEGCPPANVEN